MKIEFDPAKDKLNRRNHNGLSLALAAELDWDNAIFEADNRYHYDEIRLNAKVPLGDRLYFVTLTERGEALRVISLRLANDKEKREYVQSYR
jgi:uncharacterized DUF497 family protein